MLDYRRYPTPVWALQVCREDGAWSDSMTGRAGVMVRLARMLREGGVRCRVRIRYGDRRHTTEERHHATFPRLAVYPSRHWVLGYSTGHKIIEAHGFRSLAAANRWLDDNPTANQRVRYWLVSQGI